MASECLTPHRVAIYAAPSVGTAWWDRGSEWLGRCAFKRCRLPWPDIEGVNDATRSALLAEPRRYGWHATLKAPMRLSPDASLQALREGVRAICLRHHAIELSDLQVTRLGNFLALCPAQPPAALAALADDCVRRLQPLAAPLSEADLARRRQRALTPEEDALMLAWGYPWVLHLFRFHFSLTGSLKGLSEQQVEAVARAARAHFSGLPALRLDCLSVFSENEPGADFELIEQMGLKA